MLRKVVKKLVPNSARQLYYTWLAQKEKNRFGKMEASELFDEIYRTARWGPRPGFDSGPGSRDHFTVPYTQAVLEKVIFPYRLKSMCDVGCGDFEAGRQFTPHLERYIGLDVAPSIVAHHQKAYSSDKVSFSFMNAAKQRIPDADICTIRQVLQHLSTSEILAVLENCHHIPYVVVTEHLYLGPGSVPNKPLKHGMHTRSDNKSGVFIELPPFNCKAQTLLELPYSENTILRTSLIRNVVG